MIRKYLLFVMLILFLFPAASFGDEFTSSNFKVLDPVISSAGFSTSTSFQLLGTLAQIGTGTSTASSFNVSAGFLYFPFVTTPIVTATGGDAQVSLTWSGSAGFVGWTVSGYSIGQSTAPGGPYTYTSVGNVTGSTRTGLTNGTPYYFIVRPEDAFGNTIGAVGNLLIFTTQNSSSNHTLLPILQGSQ